MARIVMLDTEILVIAAGGDTSIDRGAERAQQMINRHMGQGDNIYIPAPAFAECCHGVDRGISNRLRVATFDTRSALLANRLIRTLRDAAKEERNSASGPTREALKVDAMILATAEAWEADIFYVGNDPWFAKARSRANLQVEVRTLSQFEPQPQGLPLED